MDNRVLQSNHERATGEALLKALGISAQFNKHGDPDQREPDLVYLVDGKSLGIEVTSAYYDQGHARNEWELARKRLKPDLRGSTKLWSGDEPDKLIAASVQERIVEKASKTYAGVDSTWLCIYSEAPLSDLADMRVLVRGLHVPQQHCFGRLFLAFPAPFHDGFGFRAIDIVSKVVFGQPDPDFLKEIESDSSKEQLREATAQLDYRDE